MNSSVPQKPKAGVPLALVSVCLFGAVATVALNRHWPRPMREFVISSLGGVPAGDTAAVEPEATAHGDAHDHAHDHEGHVEENSLELSEQARRSIGLKEGDVALSTFHRTIPLPGMVVERRGRSRFTIIAPMTGFVTQILATEGEAVAQDQPLFELRLTHEEVVQAQADALRTTVEVDVVRREIARLEAIGPEGLIPIKNVLERKYELQKLEAVQLAQRQALLLHGLSESQVNDIYTTRTLLGSVSVCAPKAGTIKDGSGTLIVQELTVERGQHVTAGDTLAVLVDHGTLLIEGEAFEHDVNAITEAATTGKPITAVIETKTGPAQTIDGLRIAYVADRVASESRTLNFYVTLPNETVGQPRVEGTSRFVTWQYKPGQRMQLKVPVEEWAERIVLPAEAVAQDGVENYVFRSNGDHFDREPIHVEHRDPQWVVVANDGTLFPGDRIAMSAAQQLQLALKNKSGGGIDPHAGHSH